ncbi:hypothetical protein CU098_006055, partial [Rhizopus stolonifer]
IVVITAQHHEKLYKGDEEKHFPDTKKLLPAVAVLWKAKDALLSAFPDMKSISLSGLYKHLV